MSETKKLGRPQGTAPVKVKVQDLLDQFGPDAVVPVGHKWYRTQTEKETKAQSDNSVAVTVNP